MRDVLLNFRNTSFNPAAFEAAQGQELQERRLVANGLHHCDCFSFLTWKWRKNLEKAVDRLGKKIKQHSTSAG